MIYCCHRGKQSHCSKCRLAICQGCYNLCLEEAGGRRKRNNSASNDEKRENCCHEAHNLEMVIDIWWTGDNFCGIEHFYPEDYIGYKKVSHHGWYGWVCMVKRSKAVCDLHYFWCEKIKVDQEPFTLSPAYTPNTSTCPAITAAYGYFWVRFNCKVTRKESFISWGILRLSDGIKVNSEDTRRKEFFLRTD